MKRYSRSVRPSIPCHIATDDGTKTLCGLPIEGLSLIPEDLVHTYRPCTKCARIDRQAEDQIAQWAQEKTA